MNRLQLREKVLQENLSVYEVCLRLRMSLNGSSDGMPEEQENRYVEFLKTVLNTWEKSGSNFYEALFDDAVKGLVLTTPVYYYHYKLDAVNLTYHKF